MLGYIVLASIVGVIAFGAIRLTPLYLSFFTISGVIDGVVEEFDGTNPSRGAIVSSISRRFDVDSVSVISFRDVKVTPVDEGWQVAAVYDHSTPFVGNISFTVHFDKTRIVRR